MDDAQIAAMSKVIHRADGLPNPKAVGKVAAGLGADGGDYGARERGAVAASHGSRSPVSVSRREKLTSVLGWYVADGWEKGCERCIELLKFGGDGHTLAIHCRDENIIMEFGLEKPAFRILVNTMATLGAVGLPRMLTPP